MPADGLWTIVFIGPLVCRRRDRRSIGRLDVLCYPLPRRGVRVVDGAALEKRCAKAPRVRIPPSPPALVRGRPARCRSVSLVSRGRGRLVDYGAALEMRFGATRRGFESRPLRHHRRRRGRSQPWPSGSSRALAGPVARPSLLSFAGRARRGTSGALYLQSAPAGLNPHSRTASWQAAASSDVEDRVPRSDEPRTVSGPEGSSTKRSSSGAAERPDPSRSSRWARGTAERRWVHG